MKSNTYREIDLDTFPRKEHFLHFSTMANPFASVTAEIDITDWLYQIKRLGKPFFRSLLYCISAAANSVPELRQRIKNGKIAEYGYTPPSYTVAKPDGTYVYCAVDTSLDYETYIEASAERQRLAEQNGQLADEGDADGYLYVSCTPWFTFTGVSQPYPDNSFSVPCIVIGKYKSVPAFVEKDGIKTVAARTVIPINIQVNHALVDGIHIARFFSETEKRLADAAAELTAK